MHFVGLDALAIIVNNPINIFLINPNIILHCVYPVNTLNV